MIGRPNRARAMRLVASSRAAMSPTEFRLHGTIAAEGPLHDRISAALVSATLARRPQAPVIVDLSTDGGSVRLAQRIYRLLRAHAGHTTCVVRDHCASAGILVFLACGRRIVGRDAVISVHQAIIDRIDWCWTADEHRAAAEALKEVDDEIAQTIADRTGQSVAWARAALRAEQRFSAPEAVVCRR